MRFEASVEGSLFRITAHLEEEHGDRKIGPRFQGPFDDLELVDNSVFYDYIPRNIHPDALAMICFHLFFPWIGHTVEFPKSVTHSLAGTLNIPTFVKLKGETEVLNIDSNLEPYSPTNQDSISPSDVAISFGGGVDSSCLHALFPESPLVHEVNISEIDEDIELRGAVKAMRRIEQLHQTKIYPIKTNARFISKPKGVTSWLSPILPSLMVAVDNGLSGVMIGTNLGTLYLKNGTSYREADKINNPARDSLASVTVPIIQASGGISQYLATKISADHGIMGVVTFCESGPNGNNCGKCMKCLRRELMYRSLNTKFPETYPLSDFPIDLNQFLEKYNIERALKHFTPLERNPFSQVFAKARDEMGPSFPEELLPLVDFLPPTSFMDYWPVEADNLFPEPFREGVLSVINRKIPNMPPHEEAIFHAWGKWRNDI